jgi:hypothetical protein
MRYLLLALRVHSFAEYQRMQSQIGGYSLILLSCHIALSNHLLLTFIVSREVLLLILIDTLHILHHLLIAWRNHFVVAFLTTHLAAVGPSLSLLALGATLFAFLKESHIKL